MKIFECEQNSEEWHRARLGIVTASVMDEVTARGRGGESKTRAKLMRKLAGEILTGEPGERFTSAAMERGHAMEDEARSYYALLHGVEPQRVGFILDEQRRAGCSPDALVGEDGLLEIKTKRADILIEHILADAFPQEHFLQCQSQLAFSNRVWVDCCCYWPSMPHFTKRTFRDEQTINWIFDQTEIFNEELDALVEKIRRYAA